MVRTCLVLAAAAALLGAAPNERRELAYGVVMSGQARGTLAVVVDGERTRHARWTYDDRGRGPDLTTSYRLDDRGIPETLRIDGLDYRKAKIEERYTVDGDRAVWRSDADEGEAPAQGFYYPSQATPEDLAALARALLAAPGNELAIMPEGRARIEPAGTHRFAAGAQSVEATLYLITGLDLDPRPVWLDARRELFASGESWLGVVRAGFEAVQPQLLAVQGEAIAARRHDQVAALGQRPTGPLLIRGASLFDPTTRRLSPNSSVVVSGNRIVAVGPDKRIAAPVGATLIDARGQVLLPGLWDMHVHLLDPAEGMQQLMVGVTGVRDLGNDPERLARIARAFDAGTSPGPRVVKALLIEGSGPLAVPLGERVDTPDAVRAAVAKATAGGYRQVKIYSSVKPDLVPLIVGEAHRKGLRVSGHVPAGMSMAAAVAAGYDEVQHAYFWLLNFLDPAVWARSNSPARFTDAGERGGTVDADAPEVHAFVRDLARRGVTLDPTFVAFEGMFVGVRGHNTPALAPWADRLPATLRRADRKGGRGTTPERRASYAAAFTRAKMLLQRFHAAGVPIVPGTDGGGLLYPRELEIYEEAGIAPRDILYLATLGAARVAGEAELSGTVAPGKRADLVLVAGDPTRRIGDIRNVRRVIKDGVIFDPAGLAAAAGLQPQAASSSR